MILGSVCRILFPARRNRSPVERVVVPVRGRGQWSLVAAGIDLVGNALIFGGTAPSIVNEPTNGSVLVATSLGLGTNTLSVSCPAAAEVAAEHRNKSARTLWLRQHAGQRGVKTGRFVVGMWGMV